MFERVPKSVSGMAFNNRLNYTMDLNPYTYRNFFNGGGVGLGDFNRDGLLDIYLTGNQVDNKLFLNQGNFQFKDITEKAGVGAEGVWSTGVSVADVNGDSWPDIYLCKSGSPEGSNRHNALFINNGDLTFTERAEEWGLDVVGLSTDATFFDYDRDGDLDMYLLSNSFEPVTGALMRTGARERPDPKGGDKLFRNEMISNQGKARRFTEVTAEAGIYSSAIGFGLDVLAGDINKDGWPDLYITNDYFERDYLYLNNRDGTFRERLPDMINSISLSSMGGDLADLTGDGRPEIYVTDMLPENLQRQKTTTTFYFWEEYMDRVKRGYHYQFVRNTLQYNRGRQRRADRGGATEKEPAVQFSEIGRLAGVHATDWSWSALMADYDLDSRTDIYVTNGIFKDLTYQDYVNDRQSIRKLQSVVEGDLDVRELFEDVPSTPLSNYAFRSTGAYRFENKAKAWGLDDPGFSNGAAYGDLDNDGDLDLVVNNVNSEVGVYQNRADTVHAGHSWLRLKLEGKRYNTSAIGARATVWTQGERLYREQMPNRGFQSSVDPRLHFGLGNRGKIDSLRVVWPEGEDTVMYEPELNRTLVLQQSPREGPGNKVRKQKAAKPEDGTTQTDLRNITSRVVIDYEHRENSFVDFERDRLLFHMLSTQGPAACSADLNNDGREDLYLGGAKGQPGSLFMQRAGLKFQEIAAELFKEDRQSEDTGCTWFDADQDGDMDLYVASGGSEFPTSSTALADRLYMNGGGERWMKAEQALPAGMVSPSATVQAADFDQDGDQDLFVGARLKAFAYGAPVQGRLLVNNGDGKFEDHTEQLAPALMETGPLTGSRWMDYDRDGDVDLVASGEWMPVRLFNNQLVETGKATFPEFTDKVGLGDRTNGWWQSVEIADLNSDGFPDIIAGNHGMNSIYSASRKRPMVMYTGDFDRNGTIEQITAASREDQEIPLVLRQDLQRQLPSMEQQYPTFKSYAAAGMDDVLGAAPGEAVLRREINLLESSVFWNREGTRFEREPLPVIAQFAPIYAILADSSGSDESVVKTLYLGGNLHGVKPQIGRYEASYGTSVTVDEAEQFTVLPSGESGFWVEGEARAILKLHSEEGPLYVVVRNNDTPVWFTESDNQRKVKQTEG